MTSVRARAACCAALLLAALSSGCGNVYEHLERSQWHEVGVNEPPVSRNRGEFQAVTLRAGSGRAVTAGDLVYVRVLVTTPRLHGSGVVPKPWPVSAWLWTGRPPESPDDWMTTVSFGDLGSARVRAALIGHAVGERFAIHLPAGAETSTDEIPLFALSTSFETGQDFSAELWPTVQLSSLGQGLSSAEVEIVDACSARLERREATLRQWGYIFNLFEEHYGPARQGMLGWTRLESECVAHGRRVGFELGPLHYRPGGPPGGDQLNNWTVSYRVARDLQWGFVDLRWAAAALMAWLGFAIGRRLARDAPTAR